MPDKRKSPDPLDDLEALETGVVEVEVLAAAGRGVGLAEGLRRRPGFEVGL